MIKLVLALFIVTAGVPANLPIQTLTFTGPGGESVDGLFPTKEACEAYVASADNARQMATVDAQLALRHPDLTVKRVQTCVAVVEERGA